MPHSFILLWSRFLASALLGAACVVSGDPFVVEEDRKSAGVCDPNDTSGSGACHPKRLECMAWRQTGGCDPSGKRERRGDKDCASEVDAGASGFCECGDGAHVARSGCDHRPIVCSRACRDRDRHECVGGWRQTSNCSSVGTREPLADLPCAAIVPAGVSGYCECGGERRVRRGGCTAWEDELQVGRSQWRGRTCVQRATRASFFRRAPQPLRCDEACEGEETMYEVLEVESRASAKEIKKQFRTLSLKYHPDKAKGVHAAERFAEIRAAYDVLEDGDKREVYDTGGLMMLAKLAKGSVPRGPDSRASVEITLEVRREPVCSAIAWELDSAATHARDDLQRRALHDAHAAPRRLPGLPALEPRGVRHVGALRPVQRALSRRGRDGEGADGAVRRRPAAARRVQGALRDGEDRARRRR